MRRALTVASVASVTLAVLVAPAVAGPPLMVRATQAGYPAQNCQSCHVSKLPKKEAFMSTS